MLSKRYTKKNLDPIVPLPEGALDAICKFKELLRTIDDPFEEVKCVDGSDIGEAILLAERDRYGFEIRTWLSKRSGLIWTSPRYSDHVLGEFYNGFFQRIYRGENDIISIRFANQILRSKELVAMFQSVIGDTSFKGLRVVDMGCGAGGMLTIFEELGANVSGFDLGGEDYLAYGRTRGLQLKQGEFDSLAGSNPPDIVFLSHVLEHVVDPIETLRKIWDVLPEGGLIGLQVPGIYNISNNYNSDFLSYLQNSHLYHFNLETLKFCLERAGFSLIAGDENVNCVARKGLDTIDTALTSSNSEDLLKYLRQIERLRPIRNFKRKSYHFCKRAWHKLCRKLA